MIEIGEAKQIESYLIHVRGKPLEEAELIEALLKKGYSQHDIAQQMELSQGQVSKRLKLLTLHSALQEMLRDGKISPSVGYTLAKLRPKEQKKFLKKEKITLREVEAAHRGEIITPQIMELLSKTQENETAREPESEWKKAEIEYREPHGEQERIPTEQGIWATAVKGEDLILKGADGREHIIDAKYIKRT